MARRALPPPLRDALKTAGEEGYLLSSERPSSLRPEQFYRYYPNRHVKSVFWSVTGRCNFRCRHCYMDAPDAALGELSTGQALRLIDEMAECGVLRVDLTGAVRWSCCITPEGRLLPCLPMTASPRQSCFPRVLDIGLRKGLSDSLYMQFADSRVRDLLAQNAECAACPHRLKCGGGCRAAALAGSGQDLLACDRQMCGFWKGGYEEKILAALRRAEQAYGTPPPQG